MTTVNDTVIYHQETVVVPGNPPPYDRPAQVWIYPPPYTSQLPGTASATITVAPTVIVTQNLGSKPQRTTCKFCHADIISRVDQHANGRTHCCALALCLLGCWPCAFVPYCFDDCLTADHYCANCNAYIGSYNK